ncbi:hypothetical protein SU86_007315 [Candidatus Nitrosotenuis cloacae]|uniref:DNA helicase n=1 Tax=Candidatus Nitrosotenuis cloacae TaxID=1603555 RepID=A0A3G1B2V7_9ARCH|nr:hypothetical protein SU86_007315 [Candidatus Nitrosotenuis cloacae]
MADDVYLLRGAKNYYVANASDSGEMQSRLQEIGTFSDYLKESVPSFSLSYYYISSLTEGIIGVDSSPIRTEIGELKRGILHKQGKIASLESDRQLLNLPVGKDALSLESEIRRSEERLRKLEEEVANAEQFKREYGSKGFGASVVIKSQTSCFSSRKADLEKTMQLIINDLEDFDNVIKNRAKHGFYLAIKELPNPALGYSAESLGIFDPHTLEDLIKQYPELSELKNQVDSLFVHRWAKDARIGERTFEKSSAIAQGLATLLRRATLKSQTQTKVNEPKWDKLPFPDETKRLGFLGFVLDGHLETTKFPFLFDYDNQAPTHTIIVGASGCGKTITAYDMAEGALFQNIPVLVLDPMIQWSGFLEKCSEKKLLDGYREFSMHEPMSFTGKIFTPGSDIGANLSSNLLAKPKTDKESELQAFAIDLSMIIKEFCKLSDNETVKVKETVFGCWKKGIDLDCFSLINATGKEIAKMKIQSLTALSFLFEGKGSNISELWKDGEISVVSLNEIKVDEVKMFVAYYLVRELVNYFDSQPDSNTLKLLLVVEEYHRFKGEAKIILDRAARTLRKKGVGLVFITQAITDLEETRANINMKIYMHMTYDNDIERSKIDLGNDVSKLLSTIDSGFGICVYPSYETPVVVKFRPCFHRNTGLSSEEIKSKMMMWSERDVSKFYKVEEKQEIPKEVTKAMQFLNEIISYHNETGKSPRREDIVKRLGIKSDRVANEIKNQLIKEGKIREEPDPDDKRAKRLVPV